MNPTNSSLYRSARHYYMLNLLTGTLMFRYFNPTHDLEELDDSSIYFCQINEVEEGIITGHGQFNLDEKAWSFGSESPDRHKELFSIPDFLFEQVVLNQMLTTLNQ